MISHKDYKWAGFQIFQKYYFYLKIIGNSTRSLWSHHNLLQTDIVKNIILSDLVKYAPISLYNRTYSIPTPLFVKPT